MCGNECGRICRVGHYTHLERIGISSCCSHIDLHAQLQTFHGINTQCREYEVVVVILRYLTEPEKFTCNASFRSNICSLIITGLHHTTHILTGTGLIRLEVLFIREGLELTSSLERFGVTPLTGATQCLIHGLNIDVVGCIAFQVGQCLCLLRYLAIKGICRCGTRVCEFGGAHFEVPLVLGLTLLPTDFCAYRINFRYINGRNTSAERNLFNHYVVVAHVDILAVNSTRCTHRNSSAFTGIGAEVNEVFLPLVVNRLLEGAHNHKVIISFQHTYLQIGLYTYVSASIGRTYHGQLQGLDRFVKLREYNHRVRITGGCIQLDTVTCLRRCTWSGRATNLSACCIGIARCIQRSCTGCKVIPIFCIRQS